MYKKILFATDNSDHSNKALPELEDLAQGNNAEVIVLNCHYIPGYFKTGESSHYFDYEKMEQNMVDFGNKVLDDVKRRLQEKNIKSRTLLVNDHPGPAIVKTAEQEGCDLIIVGSRGMGNIKNPMISTVSNYVIHNAHCSVLLVQ
jgi:nucleotide-binding universal stress UspA family protein